jgi:hypothetical protein
VFSHHKANMQDIAQRLPAGKKDRKEWFTIGEAVPTSQQAIFARSKSGIWKQKEYKSKVHHTGIVHFVSNKIRLYHQEEILDNENP